MEQKDLTLYKFMILYLINKVDFPLTNSQISEFFLEKEYTSYFKLQQAFHELEDDNMIRTKTIRNTSHYSLTSEGQEAINLFESMLSEPIKKDMLDFLATKEYELRNEASIEADYFPAKLDEYTVRLRIKEKKSTLLELNMNVTSREQAISICDHWQDTHSKIYEMLVEELLFPVQTNKDAES